MKNSLKANAKIIASLIALCTQYSVQAFPDTCKISEFLEDHKIEISDQGDMLIESEKNALIEAANRYVAFLNHLGFAEEHPCPQEIFSLCTKNCKKIRNGRLLFERREHFADQLITAKEWIGAWSIDVLDLIVSVESRTAVIRYVLSTQKEGNLIVFVILCYDSNYMIYEINEVHNKIE